MEPTSPVTPSPSDPAAPAPRREPFRANGKRLGVFVISYNAERLITDTLNRIPDDVWREVEVVYVVDDCSLDETTRQALSYPDPYRKLLVFRNRTNRRYGGNQKFGYQYALDRGLDAVVMLHGDGQYAPELLPDMFRPLIEDDADVVIGSRMINRRDALKGGMPKYKFVANIFLTWVENLLSGLSMSEFHSGYRGYHTRFLRRIPLWENSNEWHFDTHILFQAKQANAKIHEFPIPTHYGDEVCHVNGIAYGLNCIFSALLFRLHRWGLVRLNRYDIAPKTLKDARKLDDPYSSHSIIYRHLQQRPLDQAKVLDLGFGCAGIAAAIHTHGAILDGIDHDPHAIQESGPLFRRVFQHDLNQIDDLRLGEQYDIILAADILQFLVDPRRLPVALEKISGQRRPARRHLAQRRQPANTLAGPVRSLPPSPPRHSRRTGPALLHAGNHAPTPRPHGLANRSDRRHLRPAHPRLSLPAPPALASAPMDMPGPDPDVQGPPGLSGRPLLQKPQRARPAVSPPPRQPTA